MPIGVAEFMENQESRVRWNTAHRTGFNGISREYLFLGKSIAEDNNRF